MKYKYIVFVFFIAILFLVSSTANRKRQLMNNEIERLNTLYNKKTERLKEIQLYKEFYWTNVRLKVFNDNLTNDLPLSTKFLNKYKKTTDFFDFLTDKTSDNAEWYNYSYEKMIDKNISQVSFLTGEGLEEIELQIKYIITNDILLDDIELLCKRPLCDKYGNKYKYSNEFIFSDDKDTKGYINYVYLVEPNVTAPDTVKTNANFKKKFKNYPNDGVIPIKSYLVRDCEEIDKDNNIAIYTFYDLDYTYKYQIQVFVDSDGYVDDVDVSLISKEITEDPEYVQSMYDDLY